MLLDLWIVVLTVLFFVATGLIAAGYDRMMGTKR